MLRILTPLLLSAFLANCAATRPFAAQTNAAEETSRHKGGETARAELEPKKLKSKTTAAKTKSVIESSHENKWPLYPTTPDVGSPEWKREKAEDARKEKQVEKAIQGICKGC